jgi:microcystin-dependent protein
MNTCTLAGSTDTPNGNYFAVDGTKRFDEQNDGLTMVPLNITLGATGNTTPAAFGNVMPYLAINYIICLNGNFPSRT